MCLRIFSAIFLYCLLSGVVWADPAADQAAFKNYFYKKFPEVPVGDFINGVYAIDQKRREQWLEIEEFPPYGIALDEGEILFNETVFLDGASYSDCFVDGKRSKKNYPYFDVKRNTVVTLELAINDCRVSHGEQPLKYKKGDIAKISAYLALHSRGEIIDVEVSGEAAINAYEQGKKYYYSKRGQLNFACVDCHVASSGMRIRAEILSPSLGHVSNFPVYRFKWGSIGTLHRRFSGCNSQVRAKPLPGQSEEYKNLEYFLSYMSNGLKFNGPSTRR
jgi:sulfur-oxidizing protein SoxA